MQEPYIQSHYINWCNITLFATDPSDSASIFYHYKCKRYNFDFNLTDATTTTARWRFTTSGSVVYDAMTLKPVANGDFNNG
jgi:hypothetical protein